MTILKAYFTLAWLALLNIKRFASSFSSRGDFRFLSLSGWNKFGELELLGMLLWVINFTIRLLAWFDDEERAAIGLDEVTWLSSSSSSEDWSKLITTGGCLGTLLLPVLIWTLGTCPEWNIWTGDWLLRCVTWWTRAADWLLWGKLRL